MDIEGNGYSATSAIGVIGIEGHNGSNHPNKPSQLVYGSVSTGANFV